MRMAGVYVMTLSKDLMNLKTKTGILQGNACVSCIHISAMQ